MGYGARGVGCPRLVYVSRLTRPLFLLHTHVILTLPQLSGTLAHMKRYNFFLPEELIETLKVIAQQKDMTHSALIRRILMTYVKQHEQRNA